MKLQNFIIPAIVCFTTPAFAQNVKPDSVALKRELTLEKEYTPTIRDASKIGTVPELKEPETPKTPVEFAKFSVPYEIKPQLTTLPAGSFFTDLPYSKKRGYLKAGIGSFVDFDGDLGYQILNTEKDRFSIFGSSRVSNGNVTYIQKDEKFPQAEKQKMKISDHLGGLDYIHDFGGMNLDVNVKYTYSSFNYYGYTMPEYSVYSVVPEYTIDKDINQVNNIFEIGAGFTNNRTDELNYSFHLSNTSFQRKYLYLESLDGIKENRFSIDWDIHKGFNTGMEVGIGGYWKNYKNTFPENAITWGAFDYNNILLNPYWGIEGDNWDLRIGMKLNLVLMPGDDEHNISPDIRLRFRPSEKMNLYLVAGGGVRDNGLHSMFYENRYVSPEIRISDSRVPFDGKIGIQGSPSGDLWFDLFAGYQIIKNEHFFNTTFPYDVDRFAPGTVILGGMIYPVYADAKVLGLGGSLKYNYQDVFDLGLKMTYYNWDVSTKTDHVDPVHTDLRFSDNPWNRPNFETELTAGYKFPQLPLRLDAVYRLETGRRTLLISGSESMKNINNLGVSGTYTINDTFSVFAKINNLLFQKYDLFYGYPAQNFSIMAGINILF
ncbi:MAG: hypothetical protein LBU57_07125 [Dysgonamonadaceae bacterium]|jgi:hypothetical protein|nr:hypothetical protein [Dysgonamonadaceae bacterium]